MTALIIGNAEIPRVFLVNNYNKVVILDETRHVHLFDYITTHFMRFDSCQGHKRLEETPPVYRAHAVLFDRRIMRTRAITFVHFEAITRILFRQLH